MKTFSERNPLIVGFVGIALTAVVIVGALQYKKLPFFSAGKPYSAYFTEASGLMSGAAVQVAGFKVGEVSKIGLEGPRVIITFKVDENIRLVHYLLQNGDLPRLNKVPY